MARTEHDDGMGPLIGTEELAVLLRHPEPWRRPVLLDLRWRLGGPPGIDSYRAGHLPGAVYVDLDTQLSSTPGAGGRHPLPEPVALQQALRAAGVRAGRPVVVYDDGDGSVAARGWWLLRWAGHRAVAVLDGGFAAWAAEDRPLTTEAAEPEPGDVTVVAGGMPTVDADGAAELARSGRLLDARAAERYEGRTEPIDARPGHVPGAVNAPFAAHTDPDGRWRGPAELAERFTELGAGPGTPVGAYCGSGVTACSVVLALEVAGRAEPAVLYSGSWSQWSAQGDRPVATGTEPG
jgi:thiosulfate/3-mercaptopyruvate sulfurtransferase